MSDVAGIGLDQFDGDQSRLLDAKVFVEENAGQNVEGAIRQVSNEAQLTRLILWCETTTFYLVSDTL